MNAKLPYNPQTDEAVAVAPLFGSDEASKMAGYWVIEDCDQCGRPIKVNATTQHFVAKHEVQLVCPGCAVKFQKGQV